MHKTKKWQNLEYFNDGQLSFHDELILNISYRSWRLDDVIQIQAVHCMKQTKFTRRYKE